MNCKLLFTCVAVLFMTLAGYAQTTTIIGAGASPGGAFDNGAPIYRSSAGSGFDFSQSILLYSFDDLFDAGIFNGAIISSIAFNKTSVGAITAGQVASLDIRMNNSASLSLSTQGTFANLTTGSTLVYSSIAVDDTILTAAPGYVVFELTTPFVYSGGSLEIALDWDISAVSGNPATGAFQWAFDTTTNIQARGTSDSVEITDDLDTAVLRRYQAQIVYTGGAAPTCLQPNNLDASGTTATTASLSWNERNATPATLWDVEIVPAGTAPTGTPTNAGVSNPFNAMGLSSATEYDFYVRAECSATSVSSYSAPFTFSTPAACGDIVYDTGGATGNYSANESYTVTYLPDSAGNVVTLNFTLVDLETCCDDLEVFDGEDVNATPFTTDLIAPASFRATNPAGAITIRFTSDGSIQGAGWVATYTCAPPPTCLEPTALTATGITANTAQLAWTSGGSGETTWDVEIVPAGTAPTGTPTNAGVSNPFNAMGLSSATEYDFYVRAECSATSVSPYSAPFTFSTLAACGDTVYDTGGATGEYSPNESYTVTYLPDAPGNVVTLNFTLVDLENCCDDLEVFDGVDVNATPFTTDLIAPASFRATNTAGAITIRFTSDGSVQGDGWVATYTCAPAPTCLEPTALTATGITATTAQLAWTSGGSGETTWDVEIVAAGTAPTGTPTFAGVSNPYTAMALTSDTAYDFYVRAACSATDFSPYTGPLSFRTLCSPVTAYPVTTDFTNNVPNTCWSEAGMGELTAGPSGFGASDWRGSRSYTNIAGALVPSNAINLFFNNDREWLISGVYDLGTGSYNLAVEVAVTNWNSSTVSDTMGSDDSVILAITTDNGVTWTPLTTWNVGNQPAVTGTEFFASLSSYSGLVQFAFFASDGTVDDSEDYDFHVGSFRIETTAGTSDTALAASLSLYPNPVNGDELNIAFDQSIQETVNVTIVNMTGQVIRTERFDQVSNTVTLNNMTRLATGVYFVNVTQGTQSATLKFIKQ